MNHEPHSLDSDAPVSVRQAVLDKIKKGNIRKLPHIYFFFRIFATVVVSVILLLLSAFILSFIFFSIHESGEHALLGFGPQGILVFLVLFPWPLFLLDLVMLFLLEWLLRGFKFGYRIPLLNIFLGIFGVSILSGLLITATPLQGFLLHRADRDELPVVGGAYEHIFDKHDDQGVCRGIVSSTTPDGFIMQHTDLDHDSDDGTFVVSPAPGAMLPLVAIGDRVIVFGQPQPDGDVYAEFAQILPPLPPMELGAPPLPEPQLRSTQVPDGD